MVDRQVWLKRLRVGSKVVVRHPWFDKVVPGGETKIAKVERLGKSVIIVDGKAYNRKTGKHSSNDLVEPTGADQ